MKITALDNVTCEDLGLHPAESSVQTLDLIDLDEIHTNFGVQLDEIKANGESVIGLVNDALRTAWRRGIAFALSGQMPEIPVDWVVGQDRESYTDDQDRESYTHDPGVCI